MYIDDGDDMKSNDKLRSILTPLLFLGSIVFMTLPVLFFTTATGSDSFTASATVSNQAPTVSISAGQSWTGSAGNTVTRSLYFNATDTNGVADLDDGTAAAAINQSGTTIVANSCGFDRSIDGDTNQYECNFTLAYFQADGTWTIEANISDNQASAATNTQDGTVNTLDAIDVIEASIAFSGNPGDNNVAASPNPQTINNTGNQIYTSVNLTAYSFTSGANVLGVDNVTVNVSNSAIGQSPTNATELEITSASLTRGAVATEDLYFFLDIPAAQATGTYNAQNNWVLEAIQ